MPRNVAECVRANDITHVLNAADPRFVMPIFTGAFEAGAHYMDMAMSLSDRSTPTRPYEQVGKKLGDDQFAVADRWEATGLLALCGLGIEPGAADVFAKYAATHLFSRIDEVGVRDGANLEIAGLRVRADVQHLDHDRGMPQPAGDLGEGSSEVDGGWYTTAPFSEPEMFTFPEGIGDVECVNVEHEEVLLVPAVDRLRPGDVQVRAGRRVHQGARGAAQDRPGPGRDR